MIVVGGRAAVRVTAMRVRRRRGGEGRGDVGGCSDKGQHLPGCEIGVNVNLLDNEKSLTQKLNGFELGRCAPSQIR